MKRRVHKPLVLDDEESTPGTAPPPAMDLNFIDAAPDPDLDMTMFEPPRPGARLSEAARADAIFETRIKEAPSPADLRSPDDAAQPLAHIRTPEASDRSSPLRLTPRYAEARGSRVAYGVAGVVTVIWAAIPIGFFAGYAKGIEPLTYEPFALALLGAWAVGSVGILWTATRMLGQSLKLGAEVRYARDAAEQMLTPAAIAAAGAGGAMQAVRREIDAAVAAAAQARHELLTLREVLASETAKLTEAAGTSARTVTELTGAIGAERQQLGTLSTKLGTQVAEVEDAIGRQARMVAEASDLAETQIREAEATLAARAADLAAAAGDATDAARIAGEDLSRQAARLEAAGTGVGDQIRTVEQGLAEQRAALVSVSVALRAEQEDFAAQVESQQAQLTEVLAQARSASRQVEDAATASSDALRTLIVEASDQYREVVEATVAERDLFAGQTLQSIGALSEAARHERELMSAEAEAAIQALSDAADRAQQSTEAQAEAARQRIDLLGEAAFAAGQKADAVFDARLNDARALIEQSAELIEEAGLRTNQRLAASLASAQGTLGQLESLLQEVDARTATMPDQARARGQEVKAAVEQGVEELLNAAKRAADETQAIDAAFQERVRRNYEMLSEAVRMMGVVGGAAATTRAPRPSRLAPPPAPAPAPSTPTAEELGLRPRLRFAAPEPAPAPAPQPHAPAADEMFEPEPVTQAPAAPPASPLPTANLTPPHAYQQIKTAFQNVQPPPNNSNTGWTWSEILSDLDTPTPPALHPAAATGADVQAAVGQIVLNEIHVLGIDPQALLPPSRIDEIAGIIRAGDTYGARQLVRRLAPAAMRRLSRRVLTEPTLRARVAQFIEGFEGRIDEAATADRTGEVLARLMAGDEGRTFLLFDAALGDGA